jgi:uncharacterized protein (TIGR00725 family)
MRPVGARVIAVIGPGAPDDGPAARDSEECGRLLAEAGATVVTGGLGGAMAAAGRGARAAGGLVAAILPGDDPGAARTPADLVVATGAGEARDLAVVASAHAVIAVGGGWGTLAEIGLARKLGRPVVRLRSWRIAAPEGEADADVGPSAATPAEAVRLALEAAS